MIEQTNEIVLSLVDRDELGRAILKIKEITKELWDNNLMADEEGVFLALLENYESNEGKLSKYIGYEE